MLIDKAIKLLQYMEPDAIPVWHIRDSLLTPTQRQSIIYQRIWNQVTNFIEINESRVQSSLVNIDGEDFKTWKWISNLHNNYCDLSLEEDY